MYAVVAAIPTSSRPSSVRPAGEGGDAMTNHPDPSTAAQLIPGVDAEYDETVGLVEFYFGDTELNRREFVHVLGAGLLVAVAAGSVGAQEPRGRRRGGGFGG